MALDESLLCARWNGSLGERAALVLGTCSGGMLSAEKHFEGLSRGEDILDESLYLSKKYYTTAKILAWAAGVKGPVMTVVTACAAGAGAVSQAVDLIRAGISDIAVAGGADTFAYSTLTGFDALKATCEGVCTPFSANLGLNLGEGASFLVLESLEHARGRDALVFAEMLGTGLSNDAYHPTSPDPSSKGQVAAMTEALKDAGLGISQIDYINAHGTGTRSNDPTECRSIQKVLGDRAEPVPVSSTKSMIGHCLGAGGALEAAASIMALREGFLPPTAGFTSPREGCGLRDFVPDSGRAFKGRIAMSNSFGFGGNNACMVLDAAPDLSKPIAIPPTHRDESVVVTGFGLVHALGIGLQPLTDSDESGVRPVQRFPVSGSSPLAGLVPLIDSRAVDRRLDVRGMDLCSKYATYASRMALDHAQHSRRPSNTMGIGMVLGLATGPTDGETAHLGTFFGGDDQLSSLDAFPFVVQNEVAGHAARALMLKGHNTVLSVGWGAGLAAVISGAVAIGARHADTVIAAASDELTERSFKDGETVGIFGSGTGLAPGEGAAAIVLEAADSARKRGAEPLAEILGFGMSTDVVHPMRGGRESIESSIALAVKAAGVDPEEARLVATTLDTGEVGALEREAVARFFVNAETICLTDRLGFAEASAPLFHLAFLLGTSESGSILAATGLSREGLASSVILRVL